MNNYQPVQKLLELIGFEDFKIEQRETEDRFSVVIYDESIKDASKLLQDIEQILRLIARKKNLMVVSVDVNNYRREREKLIIELAKAAARKAAITKEDIELPPMNSYERLLIHTELATRPDVKTESSGEGQSRRVVIRLI